MPNRVGISLLSRENKALALPEEVMIHKSTGQILVKNTSGDTISFDFLARIKNHINTTILRCSNLNIGGNIFILELDNIELPNMIVYDVNILSAPLIIHENKGSAKTLISIDLDCVELSDITTLTGYEPTVSIQFIFKDNINPDKIFNVHYSITDLNNTVINHNDFLTINENLEDYTISLNGITISNNILDIGDKVINILYSILIVNE